MDVAQCSVEEQQAVSAFFGVDTLPIKPQEVVIPPLADDIESQAPRMTAGGVAFVLDSIEVKHAARALPIRAKGDSAVVARPEGDDEVNESDVERALEKKSVEDCHDKKVEEVRSRSHANTRFS